MFERLFRILLPFLLFLFLVMFAFQYAIVAKVCVGIGLVSIALFFIIEFFRGDSNKNDSSDIHIDYEQYQKDNPYWMYPTDEEPTPWNDKDED
jgi:hypothetical protein